MRLAAAAVFLFLSVSGAHAGPEAVRPLAVVNDTPVMPVDLEQRMRLIAVLDPLLPNDRHAALLRLIDDTLIAAEGVRRQQANDPVRSDAYGKSLLARIGGKLPVGVSQETFDAFVRVQLLRSSFADALTAAQSAGSADDHRRETAFWLQRVRVRQNVVLGLAAATAEVKKPTSGSQALVRPVDLPSPTAENVARSAVGAVFGPLPLTDNRYAVLTVLERLPAPPEALSGDEAAEAQERIAKQDAQAGLENWLKSLRSASVISFPGG